MPATRRQRGAPATGTVAWQEPCVETGNRVLRITVALTNGRSVAQDYEIEPVKAAPGRLGGYNLYRLDNDFSLITYHVRVDAQGVWWCDCPDAQNAPSQCNHCKHTRGLKAALAKEPF